MFCILGIVGCGVGGVVMVIVFVILVIDMFGWVLIGVVVLGLILFVSVIWCVCLRLVIIFDGLVI